MIKGCNKSIVFLKDTGSDYFDEAYFVVKPNAKPTGDIITEAERLVNTLYEGQKRKARRSLPKWLFFTLGAILGTACTLVLCMLIF